ncbi:hypothetical protein, partial [Pseudomonas nitroreducens]
MSTIVESLQNATQAVTDAAAQHAAAAAGLNSEIGAVATNAGLDPTANVGTRIARAIRGGQLVKVMDTSTTAGQITANPALAHSAYVGG